MINSKDVLIKNIICPACLIKLEKAGKMKIEDFCVSCNDLLNTH